MRRYFRLAKEVNEWDEKLAPLSDEALQAKTEEFKKRIQEGESLDSLLPEAYGVVKNASRRLVGTEIHVSGYNQPWDMVPYDVQVVGAIALHNGSITEMMTGEGKTLTATMPLYLNALTGKPVHLVTVNDYLAQRDCEWVGTLLRWLGITTSSLTGATPMEQRKSVYEAGVVYGTASEFGFDYLRDNSMALSKNEQVQRGFYYTIIDEVDSILIDEARTPLIISGPVPESRQMYDELKDGVNELVKLQRDYCNRLATEAKKLLDNSSATKEDREEAFKKLWLVSKGTPRNKVLKRIKEDPDMRAELDSWDLYYYSDVNKQERAETLGNLFMVIDERNNEYELTDKGSAGWEKSTGGTGSADDFVMLDISDAYIDIDEDTSLSDAEKVQKKLEVQEEDATRKERAHNLRQLLRAHLMMERDVDYIIQNDAIVIIDENTGRAQPGRRFSDGLHQSIEAKEGLKVQQETQTYATITLQNFFRMYDKLGGMTGTAITEAQEFKQIYGLEVLQIPTYKPCVRVDHNDEIYMTEREKYAAMLTDIKAAHEKGQPILIGTESVDISEKVSRICKQNQLTHSVLNAKHNDSEAEIIAHAGKKGAITIATNMAGRGTDIKLESGIADLGGLYVIGTTRHQSRRIDRQLRGRSARLGDPGSSKFYVSFEDTLLRLFASPRLTGVLQRFRPPEGEPISAGILNKSIETAQKRVEQRNYMMRKHTLEYDDVMNKQRREIYTFRNDILHNEDIEEIVIELLRDVCAHAAEDFFLGGTNPEGYRQWLMEHFPVSFDEADFAGQTDIAMIEEIASKKVVAAFKERLAQQEGRVALIQQQDSNVTLPKAIEAARRIILRKLDKLWQEHLLAMDHLRSDVNLRTVGQRDPLMEFKHEAFTLFGELSKNLRQEIAHDLFRFEITPQKHVNLERLLAGLQMETHRSFGEELEGAEAEGTQEKSAEPEKVAPVTVGPKTGRNDPCPCGSGKKYKQCCGQ